MARNIFCIQKQAETIVNGDRRPSPLPVLSLWFLRIMRLYHSKIESPAAEERLTGQIFFDISMCGCCENV